MPLAGHVGETLVATMAPTNAISFVAAFSLGEPLNTNHQWLWVSQWLPAAPGALITYTL